MYDYVEKILYAVTFIAIGGTGAIIFFIIFAPSIIGAKTLQRQLEHIARQTEVMASHLEHILHQLRERGDEHKSKE